MNARPKTAGVPSLTVPVLLIGVGNECRGDDAAGRLVVERVAAWELPGVRCLSVRQLVPELATHLAAARSAVIVDADLDAPPSSFRAVPLEAAASDRRASHSFPPGELLRLAELLGQRPPVVWLVGLACSRFDWDAPPTEGCAAAVGQALDWLRERLPAAVRAGGESAELAATRSAVLP